MSPKRNTSIKLPVNLNIFNLSRTNKNSVYNFQTTRWVKIK